MIDVFLLESGMRAAAAWAGAWLVTYAAHSTLLIVGVWGVTRCLASSLPVRDVLWKLALLGPIVTTTVQLALGIHAETHPPLLAITAADLSGGISPALAYETTFPSMDDAALALAALWLLGTTVMLVRLERGRRRFWADLGARRLWIDPAAPMLLRRVQEAANHPRPICLSASKRIGAPAALGLSEICLPEPLFATLPLAQQESVLAHEAAHLIRRDPLWRLALEVACALFWFQPLLRLVRYRWKETAEMLCDDFAVHRTGHRRPLVESLAAFAANVDPRGHASAAIALREGDSPLLRRATRVLDATGAPARPLAPPLQWALALLVLAPLVGFAPGIAPPAEGSELEVTSALVASRGVPGQRLQEVKVLGVELDPERSRIESIQPGGLASVVEREGNLTRQLEVRPTSSGGLHYDYRENGIPTAFDERAARWLASVLQQE
ncbi:MAG TPA: M56 family metallopeptidase [Longimicrobiaceae bacterium]|nr:M56 family metallopeptidase [Longimicrobiaceae bacterium]